MFPVLPLPPPRVPPLLPGFPRGSNGKESACNVGDLVQSLGWEDPLKEGIAAHSSNPAWRILMDRGAWWATVCGVTKSQTQLSNKAQHTDVSHIPSAPSTCSLLCNQCPAPRVMFGEPT